MGLKLHTFSHCKQVGRVHETVSIGVLKLGIKLIGRFCSSSKQVATKPSLLSSLWESCLNWTENRSLKEGHPRHYMSKKSNNLKVLQLTWCLPVKKKVNSRKVLHLTRAQVPVTIPNQKGLHHTITYMPVQCTVYTCTISTNLNKRKEYEYIKIEDDIGQSHHLPLSVLCDVG